MHRDTTPRPPFTTSVHTSPLTAAARIAPKLLGDHLAACVSCQHHLLRLRRAVEAVHRFAAPRFVTTLVVFTAVLAAAGLLSR